MDKPLVGIVMGSDSDLPVMRGAADILDELGVPWEIIISSAHRAPEKTADYARRAAGRGLVAIIAGAGGAAHLAGVIAGHTALPVIGVPIASGALNGVDALYATVQMPSGIPVATVAINGAKNAGILAAQIVGTGSPEVREKIIAYKEKMARQVGEKSARLQELGIDEYLKTKGGSKA
ncbi:5-(carboxyamino)imidazole ribonucleotide mutase [Desulfallas thermosapovorans]|uniref:N5-carboxyaminoimidazole ribonucleotide mutase n=1 Tax=Desulfallas thermosapovorans DSM 6562 TaxID=1121431 RepID=A0A5S4ZU25_9FIRM|nr:5-(carboxyamino)imidazole ribonucleotide mutase [Desulfallas thermosapovorans]TYO96277.1 5-(carboxyamino)imidazole ribonucleotide mutase [Desulfallas thermosapovorans DSM 6562]